MTERITIEGPSLTVTHDQANPKRKRPPRFAPSEIPADYLSLEDLIGAGNPFWSDEANDVADASDLPPRVHSGQRSWLRSMPPRQVASYE